MWRGKDASVKLLRLSFCVDNRLLLLCRQLLQEASRLLQEASLRSAQCALPQRGTKSIESKPQLQKIGHHRSQRETRACGDDKTRRSPSDNFTAAP
jgi:hypothetical protein